MRSAASRRQVSETRSGDARDAKRAEQESVTPAENELPANSDTEPSGNGYVLRAPIAGTFYRSPSPSSPAYCEVGDKVSADDVVGLVEVMKLFNSVSAGTDGVVTRFFADNAQSVSAGDPLMQIERET
jgi:acetyl-CoA carboxylase biotin carboxyl carrier protein